MLQTFVERGLGSALIQKKDADDVDFSTVFYFNLVSCAILYAVIFFAAKPIADYFARDQLTSLIRVSGITLLIAGVSNIQHAFVARKMIFKRFFFATLVGTIIAAIVGISMAYMGCGVWALVAQNLINRIIDTIVLWITVRWRPVRRFSFARLKALWSFGWKLLASTLLDRTYRQLRSLIIGKLYSSTDLAYYNKGEQYPSLIIDNIDESINSVLFPVMSSAQDSREAVKSITRRALRVGSYILMPMLMGLAVCSDSLIRLMLTEKWMPCVPYLRVFCFYYALRPLTTANLNAVKALGRSDLVLTLDIREKLFGTVIILITVNISVYAIAIGFAVQGLIAVLINAQPNIKLLGYTAKEQLSDLLPSVLLTCAMGAVVYSITFLGLNDMITLLIQVPVGIFVYILLSKLFHVEVFQYILEKILPMLRRQKKSSPDNAPQS